MGENSEFSARIGRLATGRQPIGVNGRRYWSPSYEHWYVNSGPVEHVRADGQDTRYVLAVNAAGLAIRVPILPQKPVRRAKGGLPFNRPGTERLRLVSDGVMAEIRHKAKLERAFRKMQETPLEIWKRSFPDGE